MRIGTSHNAKGVVGAGGTDAGRDGSAPPAFRAGQARNFVIGWNEIPCNVVKYKIFVEVKRTGDK